MNNIITTLAMSFLSAQWHVQTNGILHQNFVGYAIDAVNENTVAFIIHTDFFSCVSYSIIRSSMGFDIFYISGRYN